MPRGKPSYRNPERHSGLGGHCDFTVYDYANVEAGRGLGVRMKKGLVNPLVNEVKQLTGKASRVVDELDWFDKDLSDFDVETHRSRRRTDSQSQEDDSVPMTCDSRSQSPSPCRVAPPGEQSGKSYPLDVWYTISSYIAPEDVAKFASICSATHYIVHTSVFWIQLYRRHYSPDKSLPEELKPQTIERVHGIKERVVRSLFFTYPPFVARSQSSVPFDNLSLHLEGSRCALMWHRRQNKYWNFYFKFYHPHASRRRGCSLTRRKKPVRTSEFNNQVDLINGLDDVDFNGEGEFCVLQVTCGNFISTSSVMGMVLSKLGLSVAQGMQFHKVRLVFQSPQLHAQNSHSTADALTVVLDPVINAKVLYWWDQKYPRPGSAL